jgi:hypothetical protein
MSLTCGYDFQTSNINGYGVVDQTKVLYEIFKDISTYPVKMICNPRKSGKSFHSSTISPYYGSNMPLNKYNDEFFRGLNGNPPAKIYEMAPEDYRNYAVLSFSWMIYQRDYKESMKHIQCRIKENSYFPEEMNKLCKRMNSIETMTYAINSLAEMTGKKVIVVIDKYDTPLIECVHPELLKCHQDLYHNIATNPHLKALLLFGIHEFPLNIPIKIYSQLHDPSLLPYYAYSTKDVIKLFKIFREDNPGHHFVYDEKKALRDFNKSCIVYSIDGADYFNKCDVNQSISEELLELVWNEDISYIKFAANKFDKNNQEIIRCLIIDLINEKSCKVTLNIPSDFIPTYDTYNPIDHKYEQLYYWIVLIYTGYLRAIPSNVEHEYIISIPNDSLKKFFGKILLNFGK